MHSSSPGFGGREVEPVKRRDFLHDVGAAVAGGVGLTAGGDGLATQDAATTLENPPTKNRRRRVLVTSGHAELSSIIARELGRDHEIRVSAPVDIQTEFEFAKTHLDRDESTMLAVHGADAIVHVAEPMPDADDTARYDHRMRCTYNLLWAADEQRVRNVVYLSSLRMMTAYDEGWKVDEDWQPLPTPASQALPDYLGEFTCREFAREAKLNVIVLRMGNIMWSEALGDGHLDRLWVDPRDVAHAVSRAAATLLNTDPPPFGRWSVFHIQADTPRARFSVDTAKRLLGYRPQHDGSRP